MFKNKYLFVGFLTVFTLVAVVGIYMQSSQGLRPKAAYDSTPAGTGNVFYAGDAGIFIGKSSLIERAGENFSGFSDVSLNPYGGAGVRDGMIYSWGESLLGNGEKQESNQEVTEDQLELKRSDIDSIDKVFTINNKSLKNPKAEFGEYDNFTFAIRNDNTVWSWGISRCGLLANSEEEIYKPSQIKALSGTVDLAFANDAAFALKSDGSVWSWGCNKNGLLGNRERKGSTKPTQIKGLAGIVKISAFSSSADFGDHVLALDKDGKVYAWGLNTNGQLGTGNNERQAEPILIKQLEAIVDIAAGANFSYAIDRSGQLFTWGDNTYGELGLAENSRHFSPTKVEKMNNIQSVYTGGWTGYIQNFEGQIFTAGSGAGMTNGDGYLNQNTFQELKGINFISKISATHNGAMFLASDKSSLESYSIGAYDGEIFHNYNGIYTKIPNSADFIQVDAMLENYVAVNKNGTVWTWKNTDIPTQVKGLEDIKYTTLGTDPKTNQKIYFALTNRGEVYAWGQNDKYGRLGIGYEFLGKYISEPIKIDKLERITSISATAHHVAAINEDGQLFMWGLNDYGQFGFSAKETEQFCEKTKNENSCPTPILIGDIQAKSVAVIAAEKDHNNRPISLVLTTEGQIKILSSIDRKWNLGNLKDIVEIATDKNQGGVIGAIRSDGTVWVFGDNSYSQMARKYYVENYSDVYQVEAIEDAVKIGVKYDHITVLKKDGTAWTWGNAQSNGIGKSFISSTPRQIPGFSQIKSISSNPDLILTGGDPSPNGNQPGDNNPSGDSGSCLETDTSANTDGQTSALICIDAGQLSLYAGDSNKNNDICSSDDILNGNTIDATISNQSISTVDCSDQENSIALSPVVVGSTRQNSIAQIDDIVFEDLRGLSQASYTITATVSNFTDTDKSIALGSNPDNESQDQDEDAPSGQNSNQLFATLNPSVGSISILRDALAISEGRDNYQLGQNTTLTDNNTSATLLSTTTAVHPARAALDGVIFKLRIPSQVQVGSYKGVITQTIV